MSQLFQAATSLWNGAVSAIMPDTSANHTGNHVRTVYYGTFISLPREPEKPPTSTTAPGHQLIVKHGTVWVGAADGRIQGFDWTVRNEQGLDQLINSMGWTREESEQGQLGGKEVVKVVKARSEKNEFFFPGFVDTHIHAPQYPNSGIFGSSTLLDWLERYTFPLESSFGDKQDPSKAPQTAHTAYERVVSRTLSHGTTCASYFATIHVPATNLLASICLNRGQRALIGRVCMDDPDTCPEHYREESASESVDATKATMDHIHSIDPYRTHILPIITPRFAISCTSEAMAQLGKLAASTSPPTHIQTHLSENLDEIDFVRSRFPNCSSYTQVYDNANLLTTRSILAHGVHLTKDERALIRARDSKISHCPTSNSAIGSGLCPVRELLDDGITVGLGTDVSGGYSPSLLETARQACLVSRLVAFQRNPRGARNSRESLSVEEALYLATRGGAKVVGMEDTVGGFEEGMFWDVQMVGLGGVVGNNADGGADDGDDGPVDVFGWESWEEKIAKWLWNGDDRNVRAVWVGGRLVHIRN